jgi:hypothetical protein
MITRTSLATALAGALAAAAVVATVGSTPASAAQPEPPSYEATLLKTYPAFDANQGVAVDDKSFYAVDNTSITKHSRTTGEPLLQVAGSKGGPLIHMDSGEVDNGKIYAAHSNYGTYPMTSSIEVFDARTMKHIASHSFGIDRGSLTWLTRHDASWWAGFANYDVLVGGKTYGETYNTKVVQMDDNFQAVASYTIPKQILDRLSPMSSSGGSWGPDGRLWLSGHDDPEVYVMELPQAGSELTWTATVDVPGIEGQGIAWDLTGNDPTLWGIQRSTKQVKEYKVDYSKIQSPTASPWKVLGPGQFS